MSWSFTVRAQRGTFELDVTLEGEASLLAIVGPNGSGKTTLLRSLTGAIPAQTHLVVHGETLISPASSPPPEVRRIGYVPQGYGLFPHLNVLQNVAFGLSTRQRHRPKAVREATAQALLDDLQCSHLTHRRVEGLSGGERQRVALARALAIDPALLLLDEPLAALDATTRRQVRQFLGQTLRQLSCPALLVTHDVRDLIALDADTAVLEEGRVVQRGSVDALRANPASAFVAELVEAP
ncbi:MAG: ABC transporter ATP-binding protein [Myxococcota bacterium]